MKWYNYTPTIAMIVHQVMKEMNPNEKIADFSVERKYWEDFALFFYTDALGLTKESLEEYFGKDVYQVYGIVLDSYLYNEPVKKDYYKFDLVQKRKCITYIFNTLLNYDSLLPETINRNMMNVFIKVYNILKNKETYNLQFTTKENTNGYDISEEVEIITSALVLIDFLLNDTCCSEEDSELIKSNFENLEKSIAKQALVGKESNLKNEAIAMYFCFYLYYAEEYTELMNRLEWFMD